ncbi:MAG TPA: class I SAM-dependent methyltransferase [Nocardioidaceae bacterium]|nr:class I SAM-dependent methyltransferase [Nocardioidaceae bacterium]
MVLTSDTDYADRLVALQEARWKRLVNVQAPWHWDLRRQGLGRTLDIGCGIGRMLRALPPGSVGVDHNELCVQVARERGLEAYTVDEFFSRDSGMFDGFLVAHVIEHLDPGEGLAVMRSYLDHLRPGGKVLFVCPQERGYASDPTHVRWTTGEDLVQLASDLGLDATDWTSFPFPRRMGKVFIYNEFRVLATKSEGRGVVGPARRIPQQRTAPASHPSLALDRSE